MFQLPFPIRDANAGSGSDNLGNLPEWNLDDLYAGEDAPELSRDLDWLEGECTSFAADYEGKIGNLDADGRSGSQGSYRMRSRETARGILWHALGN